MFQVKMGSISCSGIVLGEDIFLSEVVILECSIGIRVVEDLYIIFLYKWMHLPSSCVMFFHVLTSIVFGSVVFSLVGFCAFHSPMSSQKS